MHRNKSSISPPTHPFSTKLSKVDTQSVSKYWLKLLSFDRSPSTERDQRQRNTIAHPWWLIAPQSPFNRFHLIDGKRWQKLLLTQIFPSKWKKWKIMSMGLLVKQFPVQKSKAENVRRRIKHFADPFTCWCKNHCSHYTTWCDPNRNYYLPYISLFVLNLKWLWEKCVHNALLRWCVVVYLTFFTTVHLYSHKRVSLCAYLSTAGKHYGFSMIETLMTVCACVMGIGEL